MSDWEKDIVPEEYEDDDIITLRTADGDSIDFIEIAGVRYNDNFYVILQPVELIDGMSDDEALVFKVSRTENDDDKFEIELDDETIDAVFKIYYELLDEAKKEKQ